jgi:type I restriction enzyme S subunit
VIPIVIPPFSDQQAIVAYLDATTAGIDTQRQAHEKSIALLQEYRASLITHAVTGKIDVRDYAPQQ